MTFICSDDRKEPFLVPFVVALLFGLPASLLWFVVATKIGLLAHAITLALCCSCGFGARIAAGGAHPAGAAVIASLLLLVANLAVVTIHFLAFEGGMSFWDTVQAVVHGAYDFPNECLLTAPKTSPAYPFGLYAAYRISDNT